MYMYGLERMRLVTINYLMFVFLRNSRQTVFVRSFVALFINRIVVHMNYLAASKTDRLVCVCMSFSQRLTIALKCGTQSQAHCLLTFQIRMKNFLVLY